MRILAVHDTVQSGQATRACRGAVGTRPVVTPLAAVLGLQRSAGNAAVSNLMAFRAQGNGAPDQLTLQRCGAAPCDCSDPERVDYAERHPEQAEAEPEIPGRDPQHSVVQRCVENEQTVVAADDPVHVSLRSKSRPRIQRFVGNKAVATLIEPVVQRGDPDSDSDELFAGAEQIDARVDEVSEILGTLYVSAASLSEGGASLQQIVDTKLKIAAYEREDFLLGRLRQAGEDSAAKGTAWDHDDGSIASEIQSIGIVSASEAETIEWIQQDEVLAKRIKPSQVTNIVLKNPALFPMTQVKLYGKVESLLREKSRNRRKRFESQVDDLTKRPVDQVITDFVPLMTGRRRFERLAGAINIHMLLDPVAPLALTTKTPDVVIDQLEASITAYSLDRTRKTTSDQLGVLYAPLVDWHYHAFYNEMAHQMFMFGLALDKTLSRLNHGGTPDVEADLLRAYTSRSPQVFNEEMEQGFAEIYTSLKQKLDTWVSGLRWDERIIEGFGLYDLGGKVGTSLKSMVSIEAVALMVGFIAFLVAVQAVPFANLVIDAILLAIGGYDVLKGVAIFAMYFDDAIDAATFEGLFRASKGLTGAEDTVVDVLLTLTALAGKGALKGYARYRKGAKFSSLDDLAREAVVKRNPEARQAMKEAKKVERDVEKWKRSFDKSSRATKEVGVLKSAATKSGDHVVKITESGKVRVCSYPCAWLESRYVKELADDPALKADLDRINTLVDDAVARKDEAAVSSALQEAVDLEDKLRAKRRPLLEWDPDSKRAIAHQGVAGEHLENILGRQLEPFDSKVHGKTKAGDFIDPRTGHTYDALGPPPAAKFKLAEFEASFVGHLRKSGVTFVFVDLSSLSGQQLKDARAMIKRVFAGHSPPPRLMVHP